MKPVFETVWTFKIGHIRVELDVCRTPGYQYDGDDLDGETQAGLDMGELVAFDSRVTVYVDDVARGEDHLGASVYSWAKLHEFWTAHRTSPAEYRNMSGHSYCVCHYFPEMVRNAIRETREDMKRAAA